MTALDSAVAHRPARTARRDAERIAASLVRRVRRTTRTATGVAVVALLVAVTGLVLDVAILLAGLLVSALALYVRLAVGDAQRRGPVARRGTSLHVLFERDMHEHLAQLAAELGVRCPTDVYVVAEPEVRLTADPDDPMLCIGSSLLWHFDVSELDRLVAAPLSSMRAVIDPEIRPGLLLAARLDCGRLTADTTPVVGGVVRRLGRRLETARATLLEAVHEWGDGSVPRRLRPTASDEAEMAALREVDELESERREAAAGVGAAMQCPAAGAMATLSACERVGALEPREPRVVVRPAISLLMDPGSTDRRLAERLATQVGADTAIVPRPELPARVWMDVWRRERDAGLPVVVNVTGRWPRTLAELFDVLGTNLHHRPNDSDPVDRVPLLGALLTRRPQRLAAGPHSEPDHVGDQHRLDAVVRLVSAAVRVVVVEQRRARLGWDDVWGAQLFELGDESPDESPEPAESTGPVEPGGPEDPLHVDAAVADAVGRRDPRVLVGWLDSLGIDIDRPWDDSEPPEGGLDGLPIAVVAAEFEAGSARRPEQRRADIVVMDGWLLGYPHERVRGLVRAVLSRLRSGSRGTRELAKLARTNRHQLVELAETDFSVRLLDVVSAELDGRTDGSGWWLRLDSPDRRLVLTGRGRPTQVAAALHRDLGARLTRAGTAHPGVPGVSWTARLLRLTSTLAAAATLLGAGAVLAGYASGRYLPGAGAWEHAVSVLVLGSVVVLGCRLGHGAANRSVRRRADPPRLPTGRRRNRAATTD